jgi:anthranilate phosphoribosyltransferase
MVRGVLDGSIGGAARAAVVLNAGAAIYVAGRAASLTEGVEVAARAVEEGLGLVALERLRTATHQAGA